jgi:hypothetical protein
MEVILKMGNCKKHYDKNLDIKDLIKLLESENNQIESSFESIEGLLKRNEKLAEHFLGIRTKKGKY